MTVAERWEGVGSSTVLARAAALGLLLIAELLALTVTYDTGDLLGKGAVTVWTRSLAAPGLRFLLALSAAALVLGWPVWRQAGAEFWRRKVSDRIDWWALVGHGVLGSGVVALANAWLAPGVRGGGEATLLLGAALVAAGGATWLAIRGLVGERIVWSAARTLGWGWLLAGSIAGVAALSTATLRSFWAPSTGATFEIVRWILGLFASGVQADAAAAIVGTEKFSVQIAPECSGYEGIGLVVAFATGWLWYLRREFRFPAALLIVPAAAVVIWVLNSVRIASLILIGHHGAPGVALGGFHSQAGWIAFLAVAMGICTLSMRLPVFAAAQRVVAVEGRTDEQVDPAPYLMPFLAILAASIILGALSSGFDWLYGMKIVACAAACWVYRETYRQIDWRFGGWSAAGGILVFAIWIAMDRSAVTGMPAELAAAPAAVQAGWIGLRMLGAVITVPVAEELAFRGYLMRRWTWGPVLVSSVLFGAMHGGRWIEGTIAGLVYAGVMIRTRRLGEAVAAHAVTNLCLAIWVLTRGQWQLW